MTTAAGRRHFRLFTQAGLLYEFSQQVQALVVGWQLYELTGSKLALGLVGLVQAVPAIGLALFAGHVVDRAEPVGVYRWVLRLSVVAALMLLAVSGPFFGMTVGARVAWIYAASFVSGIGTGFSMPARGALIARLVSREDYHASAAWTVSAIHLATVVGPAAGGAIFAWLGARAPHGLDFVLLLGALACVAAVPPQPAVAAPPRAESPVDAALAGLRFVLSHKRCCPPSRSTCSPCSSAASRRSCPCSPRTSSMSAPWAWAGCARRRPWARCSPAAG